VAANARTELDWLEGYQWEPPYPGAGPETPAWEVTPASVGQLAENAFDPSHSESNVLGNDYVFPDYARKPRTSALAQLPMRAAMPQLQQRSLRGARVVNTPRGPMLWVGSPQKFLPPDGDYPGGSTGIPLDGYLAYETGWANDGPFHGELAPMQVRVSTAPAAAVAPAAGTRCAVCGTRVAACRVCASLWSGMCPRIGRRCLNAGVGRRRASPTRLCRWRCASVTDKRSPCPSCPSLTRARSPSPLMIGTSATRRCRRAHAPCAPQPPVRVPCARACTHACVFRLLSVHADSEQTERSILSCSQTAQQRRAAGSAADSAGRALGGPRHDVCVIFTCIHVYIYTYIHVYIYTYIHIYIYTSGGPRHDVYVIYMMYDI
jgi:hypothetical protein